MTLQKLVTIVVLVSLVLSAGLQINRAHLVDVLKNYSLLARALLANFVIVPLLAVLIVRLFHLNVEVATGILLMAIAPGVVFALQAGGRKKGGSLGFAVELEFIMPALSVVTFPFLALLVLPASQKAHLPIGQFVMTLVLFQLAPLLVGMLLGERAPALAEKLARPLVIIFLASVVTLLVLLGPKIVEGVTSVYGSRGIMAMLAVVVLSLATGWLLGGPGREYRRTLSIATGLRNIGLAAVVATVSFPGTQVAAAVVTYLVVQFVVCALVGVYFARTAKSAAGMSAMKGSA